MEFFAAASVPARASFLQTHVGIDTLPRLCASIQTVLSSDGERGEIQCAWGQLRVHRELIRDGVRFTLPGDLNALQWTITAGHGAGSGVVHVHCTTSQRELDAALVDSLERFVADWKRGLEQSLAKVRAERVPKAGEDSMPWFG